MGNVRIFIPIEIKKTRRPVVDRLLSISESLGLLAEESVLGIGAGHHWLGALRRIVKPNDFRFDGAAAVGDVDSHWSSMDGDSSSFL